MEELANEWDKYQKEKKQIKLKYLELLRDRFQGKDFRLRETLTEWALKEFPYLKIPKSEFAGTFAHSGTGFFVKEHNFAVTRKAIKEESAKRKIPAIEYIDSLIATIQK